MTSTETYTDKGYAWVILCGEYSYHIVKYEKYWRRKKMTCFIKLL